MSSNLKLSIDEFRVVLYWFISLGGANDHHDNSDIMIQSSLFFVLIKLNNIIDYIKN